MKKYSALVLLSISRGDITKRPQMKISVVLTDTWPKKRVYWTSREWRTAEVTKQKTKLNTDIQCWKKNRHNIRNANQKHLIYKIKPKILFYSILLLFLGNTIENKLTRKFLKFIRITSNNNSKILFIVSELYLVFLQKHLE